MQYLFYKKYISAFTYQSFFVIIYWKGGSSMKILTPTYYEDNIYNINLESFKNKGIKLIITDIDNTIVPYGTPEPTDNINKWFKKAKDLGFDICFLSNNDEERISTFNKKLGYFAIYKANKPLPFSYLKCLKEHNVKKEEAIFFGDQLFTDILGANVAGIKSVLVKPIRYDNEGWFICFKRKMELLFLDKVKPKRLGVIGNPIKHSLSPILHKTFYDNLGINAVYKRYCPEEYELEKYVNYFKTNGFTGFNVTVPYKSEIIKYLDEVHINALKINSVNTVKIVDGKLYGYSTDGDGFIKQLNCDLNGKIVKIIGAGGATPAIVQSLINNNVGSVIIYNRTFEKAEAIAQNYDNVVAMPLDTFTAGDCDILINTTSCEHITGEPPVMSLESISENTLVYDINYKPKITKFMQLAINEGCMAYNGLAMLVNQGLLAHKIWFGKEEVK